jgi:choline dehydrogenase
MIPTNYSLDGQKLALLEAQLMEGEIQRPTFVEAALSLGVSCATAGTEADRYLAIASNQSQLRASLKRSYDYIVVGSGASGSVIAGRLAQNPATEVLLLEDGGSDLKPEILMTVLWFTNEGGKFDWSFNAERSVSVDGRSIHQAMGRVLGGGSSINGMVWARGHKNDFDYWAKEAGDSAWDYNHVLEIYKRIEDWQGPADPTRRGTGGNVFVQPAPDPHPIAHAFLQGAASRGIATFDDQNGVMQEGNGGAAITNVRIRDGRRRNIPADYLYPIMHQRNLTVLTGAYVHRITFEGTAATGVEFEYRGEKRTIRASAEVILSAGAINTPKILMHSGIGNRSELGRFGINTISHRPGVGQNLQDHPIIGSVMWEGHEPIAGRNNSAEANFFTKSSPDIDTPDLHCWHVEGPYASEVTGRVAVPAAWSISPGLVRPESRGLLRLQSADAREAIAIHSNMLSDPRDIVALRVGMKLCREIGNSEALRPYVKREILPGDVDGEALDALIRDGAISMHHPTCTAKMGTDDMAVVDAQLRVYGVKNLRVADGSIMPRVTTGNTHAPCVIIGERMAELLSAQSRSHTLAFSEPQLATLERKV